MASSANGTEVELTDGSHTISAVDTNLVITVEGIRSKEEYSVTKIAAEGVTIDGADTILENDAYTFTVSVAEGYDDTAMEVLVKMGGEKVTDGNVTERVRIEIPIFLKNLFIENLPFIMLNLYFYKKIITWKRKKARNKSVV